MGWNSLLETLGMSAGDSEQHVSYNTGHSGAVRSVEDVKSQDSTPVSLDGDVSTTQKPVSKQMDAIVKTHLKLRPMSSSDASRESARRVLPCGLPRNNEAECSTAVVGMVHAKRTAAVTPIALQEALTVAVMAKKAPEHSATKSSTSVPFNVEVKKPTAVSSAVPLGSGPPCDALCTMQFAQLPNQADSQARSKVASSTSPVAVVPVDAAPSSELSAKVPPSSGAAVETSVIDAPVPQNSTRNLAAEIAVRPFSTMLNNPAGLEKDATRQTALSAESWATGTVAEIESRASYSLQKPAIVHEQSSDVHGRQQTVFVEDHCTQADGAGVITTPSTGTAYFSSHAQKEPSHASAVERVSVPNSVQPSTNITSTAMPSAAQLAGESHCDEMHPKASFPGGSEQKFSGQNTIATLDGTSNTASATWIHSGQHQAEAGFEDPILGWVGVRAQSDSNGIHAAIIPESQDAAQSLNIHVMGLNTYLAEHHTQVESVRVAVPEFSENAFGTNGQGSEAEQFSESNSRHGQSPPDATVPMGTGSNRELRNDSPKLASASAAEFGARSGGGIYVSVLV